MKRGPVLVSLAVLATVVAAIVYIPLPHRIRTPFEIRPTQAGAVYAGVSGKIVQTVRPGTLVQAGDRIAELENLDLQLRLVDLQGQEEEALVKLRNLEWRAHTDPTLKAQFDTQVELIQSLRAMQERTQDELSRLVVVAKRDGIVIPPPDKSAQEGDGRLPGWSGSPLDAANRGALLTPDDLLCEIGSPEELEAVLIVDQGDVQLVNLGHHVDLKLESARGAKISGTIAEKSEAEIRNTSAAMSLQAGGDLETEIDPATGMARPRNVSYQARVPLADVELMLRPGYRGVAKIHAEPMSAGQRLWRFIAKTFNFDF